ncbi:unnamed protein product [Prorocentrum cordatum]|uniref:BLOC-1-related complex subunit 7 n=1 Tax=Prorocentrum cordatum TaxID=2364126 RepID=A0ABN9SP99_9DINO|nr:unnamed protein product [Polarella glacialis]
MKFIAISVCILKGIPQAQGAPQFRGSTPQPPGGGNSKGDDSDGREEAARATLSRAIETPLEAPAEATTTPSGPPPHPKMPSQLPAQLMTWAQAVAAAGPDGVPGGGVAGYLTDGTPILIHLRRPTPGIPRSRDEDQASMQLVTNQSDDGLVNNCNHSQATAYGNQYGSGTKCNFCGYKLTWAQRGSGGEQDGGPAARPESAAEAARRAAIAAERTVQIMQENPVFQTGTAALQTVNDRNGYLNALQWQLHQIPEGIRSLGKMQEVVEQIAQYASQAQFQTSGQLEEGLQQIHQGESLDYLTEQMSTLSVSVGDIEQSVGQLAHMMVDIGTAVMGLAQVANAAGSNQGAPSQEQDSSQAGASSQEPEGGPPISTTATTPSWEILYESDKDDET